MEAPRRGTAAWVTADELADWLRTGRPVSVVDVRPAEEFATGHLEGAVNLPDGNTAALVRWITLREGLVVLVCDDGTLSRQVACTLDFCGFRDVAYLENGLCGWPERQTVDAAPRPPILEMEDDRAGLRLLRSLAATLNTRVVGVALLGSAVVVLGFLLTHT